MKMVAISRSSTKAALPLISSLIGVKSSNGGEIIVQQADALDPKSYSQLLQQAKGVIIAVGSPPLPDSMQAGGYEGAITANGFSNTKPILAAKDAQVPKVVLVNATMPAWIFSGYGRGKHMAEEVARKFAGAAGTSIVLKPGVVYGTRYAGNLPLPLGLVFAPLRFVLENAQGPINWLVQKLPYLFEGVLVPPVSVEELSRSALIAVADDSLKNKCTVLDPHQIINKSFGEDLTAFVKTTN